MPAPAASTALGARFAVRIVADIGEVPAAVWDACANSASGLPGNAQARTGQPQIPGEDKCGLRGYRGNPFVSHDFLSALERSQSVGARAGWQPQHLLVETESGDVVGAAPCYLKSHSRGEYVFDHGWADAYERAGGSYYPKLQVSVPFTPAPGPRLLVKSSQQPETVKAALAAGLVALCERREASSVHATFLPEADWQLLGASGFLQRTDQQFHWHNQNYASFEDFLAALASRKRKVVRRERRDGVPPDVTVHWLTGADLTESVWDAFFGFYMETGSRKWGRPYLTRAFFSMVGETMRDRILLVMAKRAGRYIAGAINFIGADTLYGRHWGAIEHHPFLHFELCYYQAIEYAITHKLACVEAGAQGEHKLVRGYVPATTYSAHYIADPALRRAIADYLKRERAFVEAAGHELAALSPFRKTAGPE